MKPAAQRRCNLCWQSGAKRSPFADALPWLCCFSGEDVVTVKDRADRALYCAKNELKARAAAAMPAGGSGEKD